MPVVGGIWDIIEHICHNGRTSGNLEPKNMATRRNLRTHLLKTFTAHILRPTMLKKLSQNFIQKQN